MAGGGLAIGIDFGNTFSCVAVFRNNNVEVIPNEFGRSITASFVGFTENGKLIGDIAKYEALGNLANTIFDVKRLIGMKYTDSSVLDDKELYGWPFNVLVDGDGKPMFLVEYKGEKKQFSAEQITSMILSKMKAIAEKYLAKTVNDAVLSVPAHFDDSQRQAIKDSAAIAGLNVLRLLDEPVAAALACGLDKKPLSERYILVFHVGGATTNVSLLKRVEDGFKVKTTVNMCFGGQDIDKRMANHFVDKFKIKHNKDISGNLRALTRLRTFSEKAKRELSSCTETDIHIDCLCGGTDFSTTITRAVFEDLSEDLFLEFMKNVEKCLIDANIEKTMIHRIVLVGGSTRIPKVQQLLLDFLNIKELCQHINPEEAVASGAAIQAAILSNQVVTLLSLGYVSEGDVISVVIPRGTTVPTEIESDWYCLSDFRTGSTITLKIYAGERKIASKNIFLGYLSLKLKTPGAYIGASFKVCFHIVANGTLTVSLKEEASAVGNSIIINDILTRFSRKQVRKMIQKSEKFKSKDERSIEKAKAKIDLGVYAYEMKRTLKDKSINTRISAESLNNAEISINQTLHWISCNPHAEADAFILKMKELKSACAAIVVAKVLPGNDVEDEE